MSSVIAHLNPVFENRVRLGIMSVLVVGEGRDFTALKSLLDVTDGNLASHLRVLEEHRYVKVSKEFVNRKPQTSYAITETGRKAFREHLERLEKLIRSSR
jgi:DNA-binding PadR family transcriptional regulator